MMQEKPLCLLAPSGPPYTIFDLPKIGCPGVRVRSMCRLATWTAEDNANGNSVVSILNEFLSKEWDGYIQNCAPLATVVCTVHYLNPRRRMVDRIV